MRIAVFNHPFNDFYSSRMRVNSGILDYLSRILPEHKVLTFDVVKGNTSNTDLPLELTYLNKYILNDQTNYSFFNGYRQFGRIDNFNHKELKRFSPQIFVITSFAFCYFYGFNKMASYLKKLYPNIPIICGGAGPSSNPLYYVENSAVDFVVQGSAELSLKEIICYIETGSGSFPANVYNKNTDMQAIKSAPYSFKPFVKFSKKKKDFVQLQLTRGCPKRCSYCSVHLTSGAYFLKADLDEVKKSIANVPYSTGMVFDFEDDNISYDREYFLEVLNIIKGRFPDAKFTAENGIDFTTLDEAFIKQIAELGFKQFNLSLTSINSKVLKSTGRIYGINNFEKVLNSIKKVNIATIVYFISGLPGDSEKNIMDTLFFLATKNIIIGVSTFYPVPSTPIVNSISEKISPIIAKGSSFYGWGNLSTKKLVSIFIFSRFINQINFITEDEWEKFAFDIENFNIRINLQNNLFEIKVIPSKNFITKLGIALSLYENKIVAIVRENATKYKIKYYPLDSKMSKTFFSVVKINTAQANKITKYIAKASHLYKKNALPNIHHFISVIIPVFNRPDFLKRAVMSVLEQTYSLWELLIIDDDSMTDEVLQFINSLDDERIRYYKNDKNYGVSYSRNRGIKLAKYDYIAFLDSDDQWLKDKLAKQIDFFLSNPDLKVVHTEERWIRDGRQINQKSHHKKSGGDIFYNSLNLCLMSPSSIMIKRSIFSRYGAFDENLAVCEDYDMWLRITAFEKVGFLDEVLIIKNGGHIDQLSKMYEAMDKYRVMSLIKIMNLDGLPANKKEAAKVVALKKSNILLAGARKRNLASDIKLYTKWLEEFG